MTGHEKATSLELAGRPEVALSQQKYHSIIHIQKRPDKLFRDWVSRHPSKFCDNSNRYSLVKEMHHADIYVGINT